MYLTLGTEDYNIDLIKFHKVKKPAAAVKVNHKAVKIALRIQLQFLNCVMRTLYFPWRS